MGCLESRCLLCPSGGHQGLNHRVTPAQVLLWAAVLLYFMSCSWAVLLLVGLAQFVAAEDQRIFITRLGWHAVMPLQLFVWACLSTAAALLCYFVVYAEESMQTTGLVFIFGIGSVGLAFYIRQLLFMVSLIYTVRAEALEVAGDQFGPQSEEVPESEVHLTRTALSEQLAAYCKIGGVRINPIGFQRYLLRTCPRDAELTFLTKRLADAMFLEHVDRMIDIEPE